MKKIKLNKKLFLNKDVVSNLNQNQITGGEGVSAFCQDGGNNSADPLCPGVSYFCDGFWDDVARSWRTVGYIWSDINGTCECPGPPATTGAPSVNLCLVQTF